jgi:uncharacterized protein YbjT (DUF2867 family)
MTTLVLGATGHVGPHVVDALHRRGEPVRALVRDLDCARDVLADTTELLQGDYRDRRSIDRALRGVSGMFLLTPHGPSMAAEQLGLITAARDHDVRVVKLSGTSAGIRPDGPDACAQHWAVEQDLINGPTPWAILRPNAFMQGLIAGLVASATATGTINNPLGSAGLSAVDCHDIGEAAATVLCEPGHDGHTYVLTGPQAPTYRQIGQMIAREVGREITVVDTSPARVGDDLRARGLSEWDARHLTEMLTMFAAGTAENITQDVQRLTGHPPRSVAEFLATHAALFTAR